MKLFARSLSAGAVAALALGALLATPPAAAQQPPAGTPPAAPAVPTLAETLARISQSSGILVVADSSVAAQRLPLADLGAVTPGDLEARLAEIVRLLPQGTQWARVYLPATTNSRNWTGDAVADYVYAQSSLFGPVGGATAAGTFEVLGQRVPPEKAQDLLTTLNLKPVYVITNPTRRTAARAAAAGALGGDPSQWAAMTPEQQQQYAQQQAQQFLNMDPSARQNILQQQMSVMRAMMTQVQQMPADQRQQLMQSLRGAFGGPGGGFGGQGGGRGGRRGGGNQGGGGDF